MAKIHEEHVVIKLSKLVRDNADVQPVMNADAREALELAAGNLFEEMGSDVIVEVIDTE